MDGAENLGSDGWLMGLKARLSDLVSIRRVPKSLTARCLMELANNQVMVAVVGCCPDPRQD